MPDLFDRARTALVLGSLAAAAALAGCSSKDEDPLQINARPSWLGTVSETRYPSSDTSNDLLTAGLGRTGLAAATAPALGTPPTAAELRRLAIYTNYRALADMTANGGYGRFYGPNIDLAGNDTLGEGRIFGTEYIAFVDDGTGRENVTVMVQVPDSFDRNRPCIVAAPSSGSRGVYGAIGVGEWGLKRGCAVAYTDKGTGSGAHELATDNVQLIDGRLQTAAAAGANAIFRANVSDLERNAFNAASPNRFAYKHAHSQRNPEKDWGLYTRRAIETAFFVLNERFGEQLFLPAASRTVVITPANTIVIAASVSNGGGASLMAAEEDTSGLIDAVVVAEPQINLTVPAGTTVRRGSNVITAIGRPLYDYVTIANLLQPCAAIAPSLAASPSVAAILPTQAANRCAALAAAGLVTGTTTAERAENAALRLVQNGYEPEAALLHASHYAFRVAPAVALTYANAYARSRVTDNLCGYSFGATDATSGLPIAAPAAAMVSLFGLGNGVPPTNGINIIANAAVGGARNEANALALSPSTGQSDYYYDGALCLRNRLTEPTSAAGINEVRRAANLRGKPAIIVHGRADALVPVNHTSRPYVAMNSAQEGSNSRLRYIEVTNAQHFEAFLSLAGYDTRYVPLQVYKLAALNAMWAHLTSGAALPPSQLVRTTPRGGTPGSAPAITSANLPSISASPGANAITVSGSTVTIPD